MPLKPLKWYKHLASKKGRLQAGAFLVEGKRAIIQMIRQHPDEIIEILTVDAPPPACRTYPLRYVTESQLRSMCASRTPQGLAAVARLPLMTYSDELPGEVGAKVLLLEDIQDPGNVGTLIRTAAAFNFSGVLLTDKCADPFSPKCVQSTAGMVLTLWLRRTVRYVELVKTLKQRGYTCIAADVHGAAEPSRLCLYDKLLLVLGNEAAGLSQAMLRMADQCVKIPMGGKAESLNVAACGAICMFMSSWPDRKGLGAGKGNGYGR